VITVNAVTAAAESTCNGTTASSSAAGSGFVNLVVAGVQINGTPPPNTAIGVPGVGTVILNEQVVGGDGIHTSSLTVNMIHVVVNTPLLAGDIVIASAHSDVTCEPAVAATPTPQPTATGPFPCLQPTATPARRTRPSSAVRRSV
jgi:hypothetical protein